MPKKRKRCPLHKDKFLTRKCYRCKKPICSKCTYRKFHHFFCSKKCAYLFVYESFKKKRIYKEPLSYPSLKIAFSFFIFLFFISIYLLFNKPIVKEKYFVFKKIYIKKIEKPVFYEGSIIRFKTPQKEIFLTFDGGSYAERADLILRILKKHNIKASFFLTGNFMKKFPGVVKKIVNDSHEVLNHTYSHPHLTTYEINGINNTLMTLNPENVFGELYRAEKIFREITGKNMPFIWRAPYGEENKEIREWAARMGYVHVRWTYDFLDWKSIRDYYKRLEKFLKIKDKRGYILLLHLGSAQMDTAEYKIFLEKLINELEKEGYTFKKISDKIKEEILWNRKKF